MNILDAYDELLLAYNEYEKLFISRADMDNCDGMIIIRLNKEFEEINRKLADFRNENTG